MKCWSWKDFCINLCNRYKLAYEDVHKYKHTFLCVLYILYIWNYIKRIINSSNKWKDTYYEVVPQTWLKFSKIVSAPGFSNISLCPSQSYLHVFLPHLSGPYLSIPSIIAQFRIINLPNQDCVLFPSLSISEGLLALTYIVCLFIYFLSRLEVLWGQGILLILFTAIS